MMTKQEVIWDATIYANLVNRPVYILRRGNEYKSSVNECKGWKVAEIIQPQEVSA